MSSDEPDRLDGFPHPREAKQVFGHEDAEASFLEGLRSKKLHHAWLIGGPGGIGKATFAYQAAKLLLGLGQGQTPAGDRFRVDPASRAARLVAGLAHPDLAVLRRRPAGEKTAASTQIPVETVRRALDMFGSTASGGGWRVAIVDSAEDLNAPGANALLKMVEEPPPRSVFFILAHQPGQVLPTIRSRCRTLLLRPLGERDMVRALGSLDLPHPEADLARVAAVSDGSVRRALVRLDPETAALITGTRAVLDRLPALEVKTVMGLGDAVAGRQGEAEFAVLLETVEDWVAASIRQGAPAGARRLAPLVEVWEKTAHAVRDMEAQNLDRRPLVMSMFHDLAEAVARMRAA